MMSAASPSFTAAWNSPSAATIFARRSRSAGADCLAGASLSGFHLMAFAEAHAGPPAVLVDELDPGGLQSQAYLAACLITAAQWAVLSLKPLYRRNRDIGSSSQLLL